MWSEDSISSTNITTNNFSYAFSIFVTNNGDIYYDNGLANGRVDRWISKANTFDTVMNGNSQCFGLFVDTNDTLYCSMSVRGIVAKRWLNDNTMKSMVVAGTGTQGSALNELRSPRGIFVDLNYDLYVADCLNHRIQLFRSGQTTGVTVAGRESLNPTISLSCPNGVVLDVDKYLFVLESGDHRIVGSGRDGFRCLVGCEGRGSQSNQLFNPTSLSFDRSGNLFVTDSTNHRIQKYLFLENSCGKLNETNSLDNKSSIEFISINHCS